MCAASLPQYRVGIFTLEDHQYLAELASRTESKWLLTIGDHPKIRKLYSNFIIQRVRTHVMVSKIIGGKRPTFKQLIIRNYEPPKTPLYTAAASQLPLMDLFSLGTSPSRT